MAKDTAELDLRLMRLHNEVRAQREIIEILRKEIIKLARRVSLLEAPLEDPPPLEAAK